ncbi:MAG: DUF3727 domain-containing protein [Okeania sp. SIO2C2]|uniref:DUF3727 domain-containing protein n=1 Tax=unclassified Okeania TaxID=2634635 RepID=UPI0013B73F9A|nr:MULTISPECIES: DUF3727 domain-containing protein [unclassified Okeania]NEP04823.1 DUF3727 domain-containing protein [Okeania sp. SIO4D6]NEP42176.1 DUF3727 domain-containing protein [Okeania sp. SIO2H7]NEP73511.1 DUF3727 domain-containing protein [Okeania sp. SIO2G5]NEP88815.1 DUF3727 domain-containing protein [Okeania sp. SIO2C2]NEP95974.1 DUF3727 domain-containing protein [Okeania sp. SIO2F5]
MYSSPESQENGQSPETYVTLTDEAERSLCCTVEYSMELDNQEYVMLLPVDLPIEIFTWAQGDLDQASIPVGDEMEIDRIFDTAKVVLEEQNLTLQRTAITLTVTGELPEWDEDELDEVDENDEEGEYYEELATFLYKDQKYAIYTPLDPFLIPARKSNDGKLELLSEEEFQEIQPMVQSMLEDQLFHDME